VDNVAIQLSGVSKSYPGFELEDVSFQLPRGYIMGLVGPNGAGKTTIIRIMMNLARADSGQVSIFGLDNVDHETEVKRRIGYVPEHHNFYDEMTVGWMARFVRQYYPSWDQSYFDALAARFGIDVNKKAGALSKGNRSKLSLALAMAHRPELLILDEPTSGLDPVVRRDLLAELLDFMGDGERSVLFSTHITSDLDRVADYITIIVDGRIHASDEKDVLLERARKDEPTASIEDIVISAARGGKRDDQSRLEGSLLRQVDDTPCNCDVRRDLRFGSAYRLRRDCYVRREHRGCLLYDDGSVLCPQ
jgi:ABC-2 type transport system ATP-binding protein